jgi:hypothetical protein
LLRTRIAVFVSLLLSMTAMLRAQVDLPQDLSPPDSSHGEAWPDESAPFEAGEWSSELQEVPMSHPGSYPYVTSADPPIEEIHQGPSFWPKPRWFGLRHSATHGRDVGRGEPFTGTSWLNRPYYVGLQIGPMWFTESLDDDVSTDTDIFGGIFAGCDVDHFWGHELHFDWATPELKNRAAPDANRTDSSFTWNYSWLYYPWGDAKGRPYWRAGVGNSRFDYPQSDGLRHDEWMLTLPLGVGVKYPIRRWLAARAELTDYISLNEGYPTQHNVALTLGLEWRFGAHPPSYWPWNPSRHIW